MQYTSLKSYKLKKGKFISPWNELATPMEDNKSWTYGRLPEYLWVGLVFYKYGRTEGLRRLGVLMGRLSKVEGLNHIRFSDFLGLPDNDRKKVFSELAENLGVDAIAPLTVIISSEIDSVFATIFSSSISIEDRVNTLTSCMRKIMGHQSDEATDIRYVILYYSVLIGKMHLMKEQYELLYRYQFLSHNDEDMRMIRPLIRSTEMMLLTMESADTDYLTLFWTRVSELTECDLYMINHEEETRDTNRYLEIVKSIFLYWQNLHITCNPLDKKTKIILGIATYSYKRLEEAEMHNLYNSISGRSTVRSMIENYIMLKYLSIKESEKETIWDDYEQYGIGQYKLTLARYREMGSDRETHIDTNLVEALVNEYKFEEFLDMDTSYFNSDNIRKKAEIVNEKELYALQYDYDSAYEHGLWGAIRECAMLKCDNPAHQYHCVPNIENDICLKSVFEDCVYIMNKTILFISDIYGLPQNMLEEALNFERSLRN